MDSHTHIRKLTAALEKVRCQLAGCLTAAEGETAEAQVAKRGDFGWSLAYQTVLDLRRKYDKLRAENERLREENVRLWYAVETGVDCLPCPLTAHAAQRRRLEQAFVTAYGVTEDAYGRLVTNATDSPTVRALRKREVAMAREKHEAAYFALRAHMGGTEE